MKKKYENDDDDELVADTNIKLFLTQKLLDKLNYISLEYEKELGGLVTYSQMEEKDGEVKIVLDDLLIPYQDVSSASVDTEAKDLIALRKEYKDKCLKIIGHWHSHNTMGSFFSGTDEDMMKEFSENKNICIFIVSSKGEHLIRAVLKNKPFEMKIENLPYKISFETELQKEIEEQIKIKVRKPKENTIVNVSYGTSTSYTDLKKLKREIAGKVIYLQHQNHKVKIADIFKEYAELIQEEFKTLNPELTKSDKEGYYNVFVDCGSKNKAKEFMVDIKAFLLKKALEIEERKGKKKSLEDDDELSDYLSELEEEEEEFYKHNGYYPTDRSGYRRNEYGRSDISYYGYRC